MAVLSTFVAADGGGYELQMGRWSRRLAPLFVDFTGIRQADSVLDLGCGTGSLSLCLAQRPEIASVCGVDLSPAYIEHACREISHPRVSFRIGDACDLRFPDASFDHALSMLMVQFVPHPDRAVREMRRVTRPGGTVAAATWDARGGFVALRMVFDTAAMLDRNAGERRALAYTRPLSRPGELERAWCDAGLTEVVQEPLTIRMEFASFADFWSPAEGKDGPVADYVRTLDAEARQVLQDMVRLAYLDGEVDGRRSYAATAWAVRGKVP